jgi:hypothetical protein
MLITRTTARRSAIAASLTIVAIVTALTARIASVEAKPTVGSSPIEPSNRWLDGLKAKHRQFFDTPSPNGGVPLVLRMN